MVPLVPKQGDRLAQVDDADGEGEGVDDVNYAGQDKEAVGLAVRDAHEKAEVEEDDGGADETAGHRVDEHVGPVNLRVPTWLVNVNFLFFMSHFSPRAYRWNDDKNMGWALSRWMGAFVVLATRFHEIWSKGTCHTSFPVPI